MLQQENFFTIEKVESAGILCANRLLQLLQAIRLLLLFCHGVHPLKMIVPCKSVR